MSDILQQCWMPRRLACQIKVTENNNEYLPDTYFLVVTAVVIAIYKKILLSVTFQHMKVQMLEKI